MFKSASNVAGLIGSKLAATIVVVGIAGGAAGFGVFSAFSATTTNGTNSFAAGSVSISDNDAAAAMYNVTNQKPGTTTTRCIQVTYGGSLDATVKLYVSAVAAGSQYINLTVTAGTAVTDAFSSVASNCTGFTAVVGAPTFAGTLQAFGTAHSSFANGFAVNPLNGTKWTGGGAEALFYKFDLAVQDLPAAQGATSGTHTFTWEAQNQ